MSGPFIVWDLTDDQIDDLIDRWHNGAGEGLELHEFLRMSWDEYGLWVKREKERKPGQDPS